MAKVRNIELRPGEKLVVNVQQNTRLEITGFGKTSPTAEKFLTLFRETCNKIKPVAIAGEHFTRDSDEFPHAADKFRSVIHEHFANSIKSRRILTQELLQGVEDLVQEPEANNTPGQRRQISRYANEMINTLAELPNPGAHKKITH